MTRTPPLPKWMRRSLQGITFWVGHRRALYSGYALGESALVAELCNMIYTHLPDDYVLKCEVQYTELIGGNVSATVLAAKARADIVVAEKVNGKREGAIPKFVVEVKRASASTAQIDNDLLRLACVRRARPTISAFLVLIAEASRPKRFVDANGFAISGTHPIPGSTQRYRVRRVYKAAHAFTRPDRAQYACALEVSLPLPQTNAAKKPVTRRT